ncbi:hypothetical protein DXG03_007185, partial [Asterophora parasitica]
LASTALATLLVLTFWRMDHPRRKRKYIRDKVRYNDSVFESHVTLSTQLPRTIQGWRVPGASYDTDEKIWQDLADVLRDAGYVQWDHDGFSLLSSPGLTFPSLGGFGYALDTRKMGKIGSASYLCGFEYSNPLTRAVRTRDGMDAVVRVMVIGNEGHEHLRILRRIATGEQSMYSNNHTLPMFAEFQLEDIIFAVFPKVGATLRESYCSWPNNSVADVIDMIMQMLEGLAFIHNLKIAHRDAFRDNFVLEWQPESLTKFSPSRPRVYLIDFETAVDFPPEYPADKCVLSGYPFPLETYKRAHAPEFASEKPYCPFKVDVWQLGTSLLDFQSTIPAIDDALKDMRNTDPMIRPTAQEALNRLSDVVNSLAPKLLHIEPLDCEEI